MTLPITASPEKFAQWFNATVLGAYRAITSWDAKCLTELGIIGKYGYYGRADLEIVRRILVYEQLRDDVKQKEESKCKRCGQVLPIQTGGRKGRPNEYCADCEPLRGRDRQREWRNRQVTSI